MTERRRIPIPWRKILTEGFEPPKDEPVMVVVERATVHTVEFQLTKRTAWFQSKGSVLMPEGGIPATAAILEFLHEHPEHEMVIVAHMPIATTRDETLAQERMKSIQSMFTPGGWTLHAREHYRKSDVQRLLMWVREKYGWDCDPHGVDNDWGETSQQALLTFREEYCRTRKEPQTAIDPFPTAEDIDTFGVLIEEQLHLQRAIVLELNAVEIDALRTRISELEIPRLTCGEKWGSGSVRMKTYVPKTEKRIEVLLLDREIARSIGMRQYGAERIFDDSNLQAEKISYQEDKVPKSEPKAPDNPSPAPVTNLVYYADFQYTFGSAVFLPGEFGLMAIVAAIKHAGENPHDAPFIAGHVSELELAQCEALDWKRVTNVLHFLRGEKEHWVSHCLENGCDQDIMFIVSWICDANGMELEARKLSTAAPDDATKKFLYEFRLMCAAEFPDIYSIGFDIQSGVCEEDWFAFYEFYYVALTKELENVGLSAPGDKSNWSLNNMPEVLCGAQASMSTPSFLSGLEILFFPDGGPSDTLEIYDKVYASHPTYTHQRIEPEPEPEPKPEPKPKPCDGFEAWVRFEYYDLKTNNFRPLPEGQTICLMDSDTLYDSRIGTEKTGADGIARFCIEDLEDILECDIYFMAYPDKVHNGIENLPEEWATKGWVAVDGRPGFYPDYKGSHLGTWDDPLVFRIGLDIHIRFTYEDKSHGIIPAAEKCSVIVVAAGDEVAFWDTDEAGIVRGVIFPEGGDTIFMRIPWRMTDRSINLPRVTVDIPTWNSNEKDSDCWPDNDKTSIGAYGSEIDLHSRAQLDGEDSKRPIAFYLLKIMREWQSFFYHITNGLWKGIEGLEFNLTSISGTAYSLIIGSVNLPPYAHWKRDTIIHELTHQFVWKMADYSNSGIAWEIFNQLHLDHAVDLFSNPEHALIEGFPEFIALIFEGASALFSTSRPDPLAPFAPPNDTVEDPSTDSGSSSITSHPNKGESVEGAFAIGLYRIFQNHVVKSMCVAKSYVPETSGHGNPDSAWLSGVADRFLKLIVEPLTALASEDNPTTTMMIEKIKAAAGPDWPAIRADLTVNYMAM